MLARFLCSSTLTESLAQASTGRNVAQSRHQGARRENGGKAKNCRVLARCIGISISVFETLLKLIYLFM